MKVILLQEGAYYGVTGFLVTDEVAEEIRQKVANGHTLGDVNVHILDIELGLKTNDPVFPTMGKFVYDTGGSDLEAEVAQALGLVDFMKK